jgi:hypothetical protein
MAQVDPSLSLEAQSVCWDRSARRAGATLLSLVIGVVLLYSAGAPPQATFLFALLGSLVAGVLGSSAVRRLKKSPKQSRARGLALAQVANTVGYVVFLAMIWWTCAWPSMR